MEFESKLLEVKTETHEARTFVFQTPANFEFKPGQFLMLSLDDDIRPFSISSWSSEKGYVEITKKIGDSEFSKKLGSMNIGDTVNVKAPFGTFMYNEMEKNSILLAGGIGITPFRCYMEYLNEKNLPNKMTLFCSNKTPDDIIFRKELRELSKNSNIKIINTITRPDKNQKWTGLVGRIDEKMIKDNSKVDDAIFYVCGPPAMVDAMMATVQNMSISRDRIKVERFFGY